MKEKKRPRPKTETRLFQQMQIMQRMIGKELVLMVWAGENGVLKLTGSNRTILTFKNLNDFRRKAATWILKKKAEEKRIKELERELKKLKGG